MSYVKQKRAKEQVMRETNISTLTEQHTSHSFKFTAKPVAQRVANDSALAVSEIGADLRKTIITTAILLGIQILIAKYLEAGAWDQVLKTFGNVGI